INSVSVKRQCSLFKIFRAYPTPNRKPGIIVQIVSGSGGLVDGEFRYKQFIKSSKGIAPMMVKTKTKTTAPSHSERLG
ncbi:MAG TPA: hypothetical protein VF437_05330, partial [Verrucomicrobiae bacterium]